MHRSLTRALALALVAASAAAALLLPAASQAGSAAVCGIEQSGEKWCSTSSVQYPQTKGWYGFVGAGGGPCNANPRGTVFPEGTIGICSAPAPTRAWRWTKQGWVAADLSNGTRGYVHPYSGSWRWLYVDEQWYAVAATDLTLEWRVS